MSRVRHNEMVAIGGMLPLTSTGRDRIARAKSRRRRPPEPDTVLLSSGSHGQLDVHGGCRPPGATRPR